MPDAFAMNTKVQWDWGGGTGEGYVRRVFREKVREDIKGSKVTRNGSYEDPAYLIEQEDGDKVLKLHSELRRST